MLAWRLFRGYAGSAVAPAALGDLQLLHNGSANGSLYAIGAATSSDGGVTWTPYGSNPVLQVGSGWEASTVKDPCLLWDGSQYVCYYSGLGSGVYKIGRATAATFPAGAWTKYGSNPVLSTGAGGAFDDAGVSFPTVLHEPADTGKEWKMWYAADDGAVQSIGYAHSSDGLAWTKVGQVLTKGAGGTWEDEGVLPFAITKSGATYYLFYGGRQGTTNPRWQGGYATFTDPEGSYTKGGGNPTLLARFNDANTSIYPITSTAGSPIVTGLSTTAAFSPGEAVVLVAGAVETDTHHILTIDSGSQVTLSGNASSSTFNTFRSFAYNSVVPRSVLPSGGAFVMFGTPFQPLDDLSPGGSSLREGSLRWTASTLTGAWAYDYSTAGLLFPLYPANTGWDKFSAENPSVIVAP